ncbi:ICOS ligand isoform X2 [Xenopus laevis]|uniref:ICOS ligand isoform X2 n=2 Tax=Xenopus laevis TaxID=8355 RepID=A0A1L8H5T3_XENLA|nr:ICOS ligand isoform X2 [Xenopus laevis]OCT91426.1 hypothetical protein XELAEV_18014480mg [Xenopus laevis]
MSVCDRLLLGLLWNLISGWANGTSLFGRLGTKMEMPCRYQPLQAPLHQLYVYWQIKVSEEDLTVAAVVEGQVDEKFQHWAYKGRAWLDPMKLKEGDFTLYLSNLTEKDQGTYLCIVMFKKLPMMTLMQNSTVKLKVQAEFSIPTVSINMMPGLEVTLICNSYGGLPKPRVWWLNSVDGSLLGSGHLNITVNVTQSLNITCIVENPQGNVTSLPYFLEIPPHNEHYAERQSHVSETVIGTILPLIVLALLAVGLCLARKPQCVWQVEPKDNKEGTELPLQGRNPEET